MKSPRAGKEDSQPKSDNPLIRLEQITKKFGGLTAVDQVDLNINNQEIVGLVGDNGAGKSTLIKMLSGALTPTSGRIFYRGRKVDIENPDEAKHLGIETVYQDLALADNLDVAGNLFLGREPTRFSFGFIRFLNYSEMKKQAWDALSMFDIDFDSMNTKVKNLSGGQRQAIAVARAIYSEPDLVIMDEPTAALALEESEKVLKLIKDLKREGISVIFISHILQEVLATADRIVVLNQGSKVEETTPDKTTVDEIVKSMVAGKEKHRNYQVG